MTKVDYALLFVFLVVLLSAPSVSALLFRRWASLHPLAPPESEPDRRARERKGRDELEAQQAAKAREEERAKALPPKPTLRARWRTWRDTCPCPTPECTARYPRPPKEVNIRFVCGACGADLWNQYRYEYEWYAGTKLYWTEPERESQGNKRVKDIAQKYYQSVTSPKVSK